jgi:hypothetical protein
MAVARAQEAVIAHVDESVRQHVLEEPTNELFGCHRTAADLVRGRCLVLKGDLVIFQLQDAIVADGHAQDVRCQIFAGFLACADGLAVHDPSLVPDRFVHPREPVGLVQWRSALGSEDHAEGLDVDQDVWAG